MPGCRKPHYAWVVAAVTFVVLLVGGATRASPGLLIVPLENEFHWSRATISFAVGVNILLWIIFGILTGPILGVPWPLIVMLGWGAGLAAHAVETYYATGARASRRLRVIQGEFYRELGPDWPKADRKELRRIRERAVQPITKRREFIDHLAVFIPINIMLWVIFGTTAHIGWPHVP